MPFRILVAAGGIIAVFGGMAGGSGTALKAGTFLFTIGLLFAVLAEVVG